MKRGRGEDDVAFRRVLCARWVVVVSAKSLVGPVEAYHFRPISQSEIR
jgi:hypothetical protein